NNDTGIECYSCDARRTCSWDTSFRSSQTERINPDASTNIQPVWKDCLENRIVREPIIRAAPAPSSGMLGYQGRSPRLVGRAGVLYGVLGPEFDFKSKLC